MEKELLDIIEACKRNNRLAQKKLYLRFFPTMVAMCLRHTRDKSEAAMIVNDGFLKVFKNLDKYGHKGSFEGWIRKIVYRAISDHFRKESKYLKFLVFEDYDAPQADDFVNRIYERDILDLIENVPTASAEVFILYAIQGYSHKEIAEKKNISVGTSKWHLSSAREKLRELILNMQKNNRYVQGS